jgi:hypothetical protein
MAEGQRRRVVHGPGRERHPLGLVPAAVLHRRHEAVGAALQPLDVAGDDRGPVTLALAAHAATRCRRRESTRRGWLPASTTMQERRDRAG